MPQVTFRIRSNIPIVRQGLENLCKAIPEVGRMRLYNAALELARRMGIPGLAPTYPIHWDSARQRRSFFASKGFGRGIPTVRTGRYISGWRVERRTVHSYTVINTVSHARFVGGLLTRDVQSRIHEGRWPLLSDMFEKVVATLPEAVTRHLIKYIARGMKGTPGEGEGEG